MSEPIREPVPRLRSRAEAAFAIMRALLKGRLLWPYDGALPLAALEVLIDAPLPVFGAALAHLRDEGVVIVDGACGTARLSNEMLRAIGTPAVLH